jgi:molybdenum cofactor synthesis domain-containing protein
MTDQNIVTACLIIIGDEILSGRTQDSNLAYLAKWLNGQKIQLAAARVVPDIEDEIILAVNECRRKFTYVFTTGGIGPTHDDITAESIARAFSLPIEISADAADRLAARVGRENMTPARLRMARVPQGAVLIDNPVSAAPGFQIGNVFVMAGVPAVMQAMLDTLGGKLAGGSEMLSRTIHVYAGESLIADTLEAAQNDYAGLQIGSYPFYLKDKYGANLVLRARNLKLLEAATAGLKARLGEIGVEAIDGDVSAGGG